MNSEIFLLLLFEFRECSEYYKLVRTDVSIDGPRKTPYPKQYATTEDECKTECERENCDAFYLDNKCQIYISNFYSTLEPAILEVVGFENSFYISADIIPGNLYYIDSCNLDQILI